VRAWASAKRSTAASKAIYTLLSARLGLSQALYGCFEAIYTLLSARLSLRQLFETLLRARLRLSQLGYCLSEPIEILTGDPNLSDPVIYYSDNGAIELRCDPLGLSHSAVSL
jgi:hypothetical protein